MDVAQQVRDDIVENFLFGSEDGLDDAQSLLESGVVDSTGVLELVIFLQDAFRIEVSDEDLVPENLDSISNIVSFVSRRLEDREPEMAENG